MRHLRLWLLALLLLTPPADGAPAPAGEGPSWLARIESWLAARPRFRARFTQIGPDGTVLTGTLWLARPGRMRIDYDPPSELLIVATDWRLVIYDGATRQVNTLPLAETPIAFLLEERVELDERVRLVAVRERGAEVGVVLEDRTSPGRGRITLWFRRNPFTLVRWEVVDAQGLTTLVLLDSLDPDAPMPESLFVWRDPKVFGYPGEEDRLPQ